MKTTENGVKFTSIKRVCGCCKDTFYISKNNIDDAIFYDKTTYHRNCFIQMCNKRANMKRIDVSEKWKWVLSNIEKIDKESKIHLFLAIDKESVFDFIREAYEITTVPSSVFQKLSNIYAGTFRGMSVGIPPLHLADMWERKIDYLNKIANRNTTKGKDMQYEQRINYDLSILVNKYDSYLDWIEKQKVLEQSLKEEKEERNIVNTTMNIGIQQNREYENNDDISNLVDDIFD